MQTGRIQRVVTAQRRRQTRYRRPRRFEGAAEKRLQAAGRERRRRLGTGHEGGGEGDALAEEWRASYMPERDVGRLDGGRRG